MKIATLTFHRALNYGAVLQTYALQKKLIDIGYETCVLDYRCDFIENHYKPSTIKEYLSLKGMAILLFRNGYSLVKRSQFESFVKRYIITSETVYDKQNLSSAEENYDLFCVGSDQIWNYHTAGFDKAYFLDFVQNSAKKTSYAASIGLNVLPKQYGEQYKTLLSDFSKISVREQEGAELVSRLLERKDIQTVVDPTLLIEGKEWKMLEQKMTTPSHYILLYLLSENKEIIRFAKKVAREKKYPIVYINNQLIKVPGVKNYREVTPENWLYLFRNADYIVTNSFHGTAFSVIFNKIFWCDYLPTSNNVNSRITTLLGKLGLQNRIVSEGCTTTDDVVDYEKANVILENVRSEGIWFLKSLGEMKNE